MSSNGLIAYVGTTYFYDADQLHSPRLTCVSTDLDKVFNYLTKVRHIPVVDANDEYLELSDPHGVCAVITTATFGSRENFINFMNHADRAPYVLEPYDMNIDRHIAGISKKDARNIMVPAIVIDIIDKRIKTMKDEMAVTVHSLKEILYYINGLDRSKLKTEHDSRALMTACAVIDQFISEDDNTVEKGMLKRHPILFCSEFEYRQVIDSELRMKDLDRQYRYRIEDPYT